MSYSPRHVARQTAFQFLYRYDLEGRSIEALELSRELKTHFEHFGTPPEAQGFASELVAGVVTRQKAIDSDLESLAAHWKLDRMSMVDRNLLRLGMYELEYCTDVPVAVTINEALELAKEFGEADSASFINGILDAVAQKKGRK